MCTRYDPGPRHRNMGPVPWCRGGRRRRPRRPLERALDPELAADLAQQLLAVAFPRYSLHTEHLLGRVVMRRERRRPVVEPRPLGVHEEFRARTVQGIRIHNAAAADGRSAGNEHVLEWRQLEYAAQTQERRPQEAIQVPGRSREVLVAKAAPCLEDRDAVAFLGQAQRRDAAAKAGADDQPVVILCTVWTGHVAPDGTRTPRRCLPAPQPHARVWLIPLCAANAMPAYS